jgi:hypothetical protein
MNATVLATWLVRAAAVYVAVGTVFSAFLLVRGLRRFDEAAAHGGLGFKLLVLPGMVALWPLVLVIWRRGQAVQERNAHDRAAEVTR